MAVKAMKGERREAFGAFTKRAEIKQKLENLIVNRMHSNEAVYPFGDYFSDENFKLKVDEILMESRGQSY
jgi:hypothetical protein